jgi:hypothetical protein
MIFVQTNYETEFKRVRALCQTAIDERLQMQTVPTPVDALELKESELFQSIKQKLPEALSYNQYSSLDSCRGKLDALVTIYETYGNDVIELVITKFENLGWQVRCERNQYFVSDHDSFIEICSNEQAMAMIRDNWWLTAPTNWIERLLVQAA